MAARRRLKPEKWAACVARIAEKGKINKGEALKLLEEVANRGEAMRQTGQADPFVTVAKDLVGSLKEAADRRALDAVKNAGIRKGILDEIEKAGGISKAEQVLRSLLHGTNVGGRDSIESRWRNVGAGWQAPVESEIKKAGLEKAARTGAWGELDRDAGRAMWDMKAGKGKPSGNNPGDALGQILAPALSLVRKRLNMAGARIGDALDYVAHTSHDPAKMRRAAGVKATPDQAFEAWWRAAEPRLAAKTFDGLEPKEGETMSDARGRFGRAVFDALVSGIHKKEPGTGLVWEPDGFVPPAYEGTRNLARKLSEKRVLYWKDSDAWTDHMRQFGRQGSLTEAVMQTLDVSARHLALMEKLGTNPTGNFNQIVRKVQEVYRSDLDAVKVFQGKVFGLEAVMAQLDGSANLPANEMWAKLWASARTVETVSYLGSVGITHFASIWPTVISETRHHGVPRLEMLGKLVAALVKGHGTEARQDAVAEIGAYAHGLARDMHARWQPEDSFPGRLSAMANSFMKWTALPYIFDNSQAAVREVLANQLARFNGKTFGQLEPHLSQMLGKYGIGQAEWDLLRAVPDLPVADGMAYMTPKDALRIDAAGAEALLRARGVLGKEASAATITDAIEHLRYELSDKLYSYYGDAASHSTVTAGVQQRALIVGKTQPATFSGELVRFIAQFKMWPLAAMTQVIGREIHLSLSRKEMAWNLGIMAAFSMTFGYVRMAVNDVATGRPVRDPSDPNTMMAALAQGGGVGILGDFLFGEVNRFENGLEVLGGPLLSDTGQLVKIFGRWRKGEAGWPDLAHFAVQHVPFANLVWFKGMMDYLLWYHLYEAASPGWWERTNRRLLREQGRAMTGYQPGAGVPWTPWGIELGPRQSLPPRGTPPVQQPTIQ